MMFFYILFQEKPKVERQLLIQEDYYQMFGIILRDKR